MSDNRLIYQKIKERMDNGMIDIGLFTDAFETARLIGSEEEKKDILLTREIENHIQTATQIKGDDKKLMSELYDLHRRILCWEGSERFDSFLLYNEINRPAKEQFWLPRRQHLMGVCQALQDMEDGKLEELFLSMPPRVGKSTLIMMFLIWVMGRDSERSNLYSSYTDSVVGVLYNGILEVLNDPTTYAFNDVFPTAKIVSTNAKDLLINIDRKKRYSSFTGRSLYGTLNGACDCNGYLVGDDLISGIEEAMNKDRLMAAWAKVDNNLIPRAKQTARKLWIGTRWSLIDPQGIRIELLQNDPQYKSVKWKAVNVPALNEDDESNFNYKYGVGFTTEYYRQRRASFERNNDMASWLAQYQGLPVERANTLFEPDDFKYYNGELPSGQPDRIFMVVDPAWGGGDAVSAPVCYEYGDEIYVDDVVFDFGDKSITEPMIANKVIEHNVSAVKVEGTKMTASYGEDIDGLLREKNYRVNMMINVSHYTGTGKRMRIFDKAPDIKERMIFRADGFRSKQYSLFMQNVFSFTITGKEAKHDDGADSLAMAIDFSSPRLMHKAEVFSRPW